MCFKKITAAITAFCFFTVLAGQSFGQAVSVRPGGKMVPPIDMKTPVFPEKYGKITEAANYNSPQLIVSIQDLHAHSQTQKNIASILKALDEKYKIKRIYTEGASGKVDVSWLYTGGESELKENIVSQMVENGALTGAEYYAFLNKKNNLSGLEDAKVHTQNIARLGRIYENE
jgi:hypothetical protein